MKCHNGKINCVRIVVSMKNRNVAIRGKIAGVCGAIGERICEYFRYLNVAPNQAVTAATPAVSPSVVLQHNHVIGNPFGVGKL